ncbi:MAG: N-acetylneuraminate synthase family protein [Spirochaetaceae bacterium]|jgi:sialic acid synthase SpsE|nr:N-acetylneuraminate synthase family protein [Spirochaetaceae bacterium]
MRKPFIIAEIGTSHQGDRQKARDLIDAAAASGADCVKFQMVYADEILHPNTGTVALPGGNIRLYDRFKALEMPPDFFADLKEYAEALGLDFLCTPFGLRSARELRALGPRAFKIASPELNHEALLREVASYGLPVYLSTGVSKLGDIEEALENLRGAPVCLLHCVTSYPAPPEECNLMLMRNLGAVFGVPTGFSDHTLDPQLAPLLASGLGAAAVEKHFCLSRADSGLDDPIALPPALFAEMARGIRRAALRPFEETRAELAEARGETAVAAVLGDGVKRLAASEEASYGRTNRSLHALCAIPAGTVMTPEAVAPLRTEKRLRPGLPPSWFSKIMGKTAKNTIPAGEGIRFEDIFT